MKNTQNILFGLCLSIQLSIPGLANAHSSITPELIEAEFERVQQELNQVPDEEKKELREQLDVFIDQFAQTDVAEQFRQYGIPSDEQRYQEELANLLKNGYPMRPISQQLIDRWQEIQDATGIHRNKQLPLKRLPNEHGCLGMANSYAVCIPNAFDYVPEYLQTHTLAHEAAHALRNDAIMPHALAVYICFYFSTRGTTNVTLPALKELFSAPPIETVFDTRAMDDACVQAAMENVAKLKQLIAPYHSRYCEHRADASAAQFMQCGDCLNLLMGGDSEKGYFSRKENREIAEQFKKEGKICAHHTRKRELYLRLQEKLDRYKPSLPDKLYRGLSSALHIYLTATQLSPLVCSNTRDALVALTPRPIKYVGNRIIQAIYRGR